MLEKFTCRVYGCGLDPVCTQEQGVGGEVKCVSNPSFV
jgi:hypothetical protein